MDPSAVMRLFTFSHIYDVDYNDSLNIFCHKTQIMPSVL